MKLTKSWTRYGFVFSLIYSVLLIFLYFTTLLPLPAVYGLFFDKVHELFYYPQIFLSFKALLLFAYYDSYFSWNLQFYFVQLIFSVVIGFILGVVFGIVADKIKS